MMINGSDVSDTLRSIFPTHMAKWMGHLALIYGIAAAATVVVYAPLYFLIPDRSPPAVDQRPIINPAPKPFHLYLRSIEDPGEARVSKWEQMSSPDSVHYALKEIDSEREFRGEAPITRWQSSEILGKDVVRADGSKIGRTIDVINDKMGRIGGVVILTEHELWGKKIIKIEPIENIQGSDNGLLWTPTDPHLNAQFNRK
jgi:hypothetical protein